MPDQSTDFFCGTPIGPDSYLSLTVGSQAYLSSSRKALRRVVTRIKHQLHGDWLLVPQMVVIVGLTIC